MSPLLSAVGDGLVLTFVACCVVSAALQIVAWSRHALPGVSVSLRSFQEPERFFDRIGVYQIRLARRLLTVGGVAYLSFGVLLLLGRMAQ
ncbi:MAG: hypothetical protein M3409_00285 [Gemmatimonadota bacterium]|nr:hypothetical protein [Gemmatimonadota bacterium]